MDRWTDGRMDGWCLCFLVMTKAPVSWLPVHFYLLVCLVVCFYWRKIALQGCIDFCHTTTLYLFQALLLACGSFSPSLCSQSVGGWRAELKANGQLEDKGTSLQKMTLEGLLPLFNHLSRLHFLVPRTLLNVTWQPG